jgi:predicted metal-dependent hydrolase
MYGFYMNPKIVYSNRKSFALEVDSNSNVTVRVPNKASKKEIQNFIFSHKLWIEKAKLRMQKRADNLPVYPDNDKDIKLLKAAAKQFMIPRINYYSKIIGVTPIGISFNKAKKRFGSCSSKNTLNFSCYLMLYNEQAIDYVIVHELCHIIEKNHSKNFYALVSSVLPDYKQREKILKGLSAKDA